MRPLGGNAPPTLTLTPSTSLGRESTRRGPAVRLPVKRDDLLALVDEARRAPSVHNIQPARWAPGGDRTLILCADPARRLPIADPSGHDVDVSLGAALEGMAIALSKRGFAPGPVRRLEGASTASDPAGPPPSSQGVPAARGPKRDAGAASPASRPVARLTFERGGEPDALADAVQLRAAYRGRFVAADPAVLEALERRVVPHGTIVVRDRARIRELAALADQAAEEFLLDPRYWRETWSWVRLSRSHRDWDRDGLNADALALSGIERAAGRVLMAPPAFEWMRRLGLARALISERPQTESAAALLLITAPFGEDPFDTGRAFYRRWLEVTASGQALCPMSALADSERANQEIRRTFALPAERRLVNVFRVGQAPAGFPARLTPRLPAEELIDESAGADRES